MKMTVYIVDDEAHAIAHLSTFVGRTADLELTGSSTDPIQALDQIKARRPMLVFLDVKMPMLSGLELATLISPEIKVVLVTSFREYGPEAYDLRVCDYLMKPFSYARFLQSIDKVAGLFKPGITEIKEQPHLFVKGGQKDFYIKIPVNDILYASAALNYVEIRLSGEKVITYLTLSELMEHLPEGQFARVQRSHIVNRDKIKAVEQSDIRMENNDLIPIGESYREAFMLSIRRSVLVSKRSRD